MNGSIILGKYTNYVYFAGNLAKAKLKPSSYLKNQRA
jgi:hypothetical protein